MTQKAGALRSLNIKPGDVVECVAAFTDFFTTGKHYTVTERGHLIDDEGDEWLPGSKTFRVVSRASDAPKLLRDMTDAEIGALVRAYYSGAVLEVWIPRLKKWDLELDRPFQCLDDAYRIKPTRETVTIAIDGDGDVMGAEHPSDEYRVQFDRVDGVIDRSTLRWEDVQ